VNNRIPELIAEYESTIGRTVSQKEIAEEADVPQGTLSRYINGRVDSLNLNVEFRLCWFFTQKLGREIDRGDLFSFDFTELQAS